MKTIRTIMYQSADFVRQRIFILSVVAYIMLYLYRSFEDFSVGHDVGIYYFLIMLYRVGGLPLLLLTLNGLPILSFVCDEWNSGSILYHLNRESLWRYVVITFGKVLLLSFVFYGIVTGILICVFAIRFPFVPDTTSISFQQFVAGYGTIGWLLKDGHSVLYYMALLLLQWWRHAIFYLVTVCMSLYVTNRYVIVTIPSILWTLCYSLIGVLPLRVNPAVIFSEILNFSSMQEIYDYYILIGIWSVCLISICVIWFGLGLQHKIRSGQSFGKVNQVW